MLREARASEFQLTRVDTVRAAIDHLSSGTTRRTRFSRPQLAG
jgi:hypothetical protein